jgi:hypothetical protein
MEAPSALPNDACAVGAQRAQCREAGASALQRAILKRNLRPLFAGNQSSARTAVSMINQNLPSREGELTPMRQGKTVGLLALGEQGKSPWRS